MKHPFILIGIIVFLISIHVFYELGKSSSKYHDGEGNTLPTKAVELMVADHYVWLSKEDSTYLAKYALLADTAERGIRYTNPLGDSAENLPLMPVTASNH